MKHYFLSTTLFLAVGCGKGSSDTSTVASLELADIPVGAKKIEVLLKAESDAEYQSRVYEYSNDKIDLSLSYDSYSIGMKVFDDENSLLASSIENSEVCDFQSITIDQERQSLRIPLCFNESAIPTPQSGELELSTELIEFQEALICEGTADQQEINGFDLHKLAFDELEPGNFRYRFYYSYVSDDEIYYLDMVKGTDYDFTEVDGRHHVDIIKRDNNRWWLRFGYGRASLMPLGECELLVPEDSFGVEL